MKSTIMARVRPGGLRSKVALGLSALMVATFLDAASAPAATADASAKPPGIQHTDKPVTGKSVSAAKPRKRPRQPRVPAAPPKTDWPQSRVAEVTVPQAQKSPAPSVKRSRAATSPLQPVQKAKGTPLSLTAPGAAHTRISPADTAGTVTARVLPRKQTRRAGIDGLLFTLTPKDEESAGKTGVTVDYRDFAEAYGGGYGSRLRLIQLPDCAVTTPTKPSCLRGRSVPSSNDSEKQVLRADAVSLRPGTPTVLAAVAAGGGDGGSKSDYTATKLSASSRWETDLNSGDLNWSYEMPVPDVPGGLTPDLGLAYSSGQIDGRTENTNNQSSWAGDGFEMWPGYIERKYKSCDKDGVKHSDGNKPADQCWAYDNAFLSFNGKGGELVPAGDGEWKLSNDDGTRIKRLASTERHNGDDDGEYWRLTDPDGTRYYFGYHRLPGWSSGKQTTDSTWTVPVFGNDVGEPCHASAFKDSWCKQAWRWNLDYVVDTHGNAVAYYYDQEKNSYGRDLKEKDNTRYVRGGSLRRIEYGLRSEAVYSTRPLAKVDFTTAERCLPQKGVTCAPDTIKEQAPYWYDTPWDLNCEAGEDCDRGRFAPSFWTRKRLTEVSTSVLDGDAYQKVDSWKLDHRWGAADVDYQLLLDSVEHTGHSAIPAITLPKTTFAYTQLENRLDEIGDGYAPFIKARLSTVADEYGGQVDANYSGPACKKGALPTPHTNTTRCFPQYIGGSTSDDPDQEWFNKYVVTSVTTTDRTGGAPDQVTRYDYQGDAAWHHDDNGLVEAKHRTWSQWRGYGHVRVQTGGQGGTSAMRSQEDAYFLRGMHGDRKSPSGGTKDVTVPLGDGEGDPLTDHEAHAGFQYKTVTYSGPGGKILDKQVRRPWQHRTASKKHPWATLTSHFTGIAHSKSWTSLDQGAGSKWRTTSTAASYDTVAGRPTQIDDFGDTTTSSDNRCTRLTYATSTDKNILGLTAREETVAGSCEATPDRSKDVLADTRTAYDTGDYGAAPTRGDTTGTAVLKKHDGTTATYLESQATYDVYGRELTVTDLTADLTATGDGGVKRTARTDGRQSTTVYSPATGFARKVTKTTPPAEEDNDATAQTFVTELEPMRGEPTAEVDTNGKRTVFSYDALGRSSKVWLPNTRTQGNPSYQFSYLIQDGKPAAISSRGLDAMGGVTEPSYVLYDGLLRERQTQAPGPDGGRILTDTFYDERGLNSKTFADYFAEGEPSRTLFSPEEADSVETQTRHTYDGLGRETRTQQIAGNGDGGAVLSTATTSYGGDRVTVTPPQGDTTTTTLFDARGRTTELRQHHTRSPDSAYDTTRYTYDPRGELTGLTGPGGTTWSWEYDQLGRKIRTHDPDRGTSVATYDDRGNQISATDARGEKLVSLYDGLDRRTEVRTGSPTGPLRASWTYDTLSGAQGQLASSTRYVKGEPYTHKIIKYDQLYNVERAATVLPEAEGALAGTYQEGTSYGPNGAIRARSFSAAGSIAGKGWNYTYDKRTERPTAVYTSGARADITYSLTGSPLQYALGRTSGEARKTWVTNTYEWGTRRLATSRVDRQDVPGVDQHNTYTYDQAGNVLSLSDVSREGTDTQCFIYDHLRRLTEAWTQGTKTCAPAPGKETTGGVAPYWHSYTYDKAGNRRTETRHDTTGDAGKDIERTYTYPAPDAPQPHSLTSVRQTGPTGTSKETFTYDQAGNTTGRSRGGDTQELTWDEEGLLSKATGASGDEQGTTEYVYDADGNRLLARTKDRTTFYWGDHTEVTLDKGSNTPTAHRYIPLGGGHQAVIDSSGTWTFTLADHHGTGQLAVDGESEELTQRRTLPFGAERAEKPKDWPTSRGFVGGVDETRTTGLTHLGAREYDPDTGRFISVDPLMDPGNPQQLHGYSYGNNSPLVYSDPDGLMPIWGAIVRAIDSAVRHATRYSAGRHRPVCDTGCQARKQYRGGSIPITGYGPSADRAVAPKLAEAASRPDPKWLGIAGAIFDALIPIRPLQRCIDGSGEDCLDAAISLVSSVKMASIAIRAARAAAKEARGGGGSGKPSEGGGAAKPDPKPAAPRTSKKLAPAKPSSKSTSVGETTPSGRSAAPCHSFLPGTAVLLADGTRKDIEDVKLGDEVTVTDPETGKAERREVVGTIVTEDDKEFVDLTITTDEGETSLVSTTTHPFWSPSEHAWVNAGDLTPGTTLRTADATTAKVTETRHFTKRQRTHDLTVEGVHTYYVLAGATPVLVHNCNKNQGIYEFKDQLNPGKTYVGKTKNFNNRLQDHIDSGRLKGREEATCTHICGTNDDLFVAEHLRMEELRGQGVGLSNDIASPGRKILERRRDAEKFEQLELW
ncbi:polymorphic toxin-type HINT domain-containing protein [Streptomyces albus]